jgi:lysophospholipase L1-like esterase
MKTIKMVILITLFLTCNFNNKITVFLIGDSTMSDKSNPEINPERGWGQMLPQFFKENVTVKNFAVNGRSTKSFIDEGRGDFVVSEIQKGDYVFVQYGHNDQKFKDSLRFTNPLTAYRYNLMKFVNETRKKGDIPVLFNPIVRRKFNEFGVLVDTHGLYPLVMRQVATELSVPFIDLQFKSENLVLSTGREKSKELYLWIKPGQNTVYSRGKQDNTHFSVKGATEIAKLAIEGLKENKLALTNFLKN